MTSLLTGSWDKSLGTSLHPLITSRVSGRGYKNGAARLYVCVSVCLLALSRLNRLT